MGKNLHLKIVDAFKPFHPKKILLFGSQALADADRESDIDLIIVYDTQKRFLDRLRELYMAWDLPRTVDILAYTPQEFERLSTSYPFLLEALKRSTVLHEEQ